MNCKKCGYELKEDWKICPKCSEVAENSNVSVDAETRQAAILETKENQSLPQKDVKEKIYLVVFLASLACGYLINEFFFLISMISITTAFIKYPHNNAVKVLFWLFIAGIAAYILFMIFIIFMCNMILIDCVNSCG